MFSLSSEQRRAIDEWEQNKNVKVVAVPGAGKTAVLIEACRFATGRCVILSYNSNLCNATNQKIEELELGDRVFAYTFHGLATFCVQPTPDDETMFEVIQKLERGEPPVQKLVNVQNILIDEGQDLRESFVKLIPMLIEVGDHTKYMIVGDPDQMIYDYADEDSAKDVYLKHPNEHFLNCREWSTVTLTTSQRLSNSVVNFVNSACDKNMISASKREEVNVEVYACDPWSMWDTLRNLDEPIEWKRTCVLTRYLRNNKPLERLVNSLSSNNIPIYVHGRDGKDERIRTGKTVVSTWHASKGTEHDTCVVLCMDSSQLLNPAFVALTRANRRLIVILNLYDVNPSILKTVDEKFTTTNEQTRYIKLSKDSASNEPTERPRFPRTSICLQNWRRGYAFIRDSIVYDECLTSDSLNPVSDVAEIQGNKHEDVGHVYLIMCMIRVEKQMTGMVRRLKDIISPNMCSRANEETRIRHGEQSRFVRYGTKQDTLIDPDSLRKLKSINLNVIQDLAFAACASCAWNSYHHVIRQLTPYTWVEHGRVERGCEIIHETLRDETNVVFDAMMHTVVDGILVYSRVDAVCVSKIHKFVWEGAITRANLYEAAIVSLLHPKRVCRCTNVKTGEFVTLRTNSHDDLLKHIVHQEMTCS